ncbi:MAG TPA: type II toxin-antitoxin system HicB family antitoxin [Pirellulaceae bacterium]|jgi:predicted RNase H-like HicB family nuclease
MSQVEQYPVTASDRAETYAFVAWEISDDAKSKVFECRVLICPEEDGGFSAHALKLPGVVSQGDTPEEAAERIGDAFRETLLVYQESGESIPWEQVVIDRPKGSIERWILVHV